MTEEEKAKENEVIAAANKAAQEKRYALAKAIQTFYTAAERFEQANSEYGEACRALRECADKDSKVVIELDYSMHLFTCDHEGNFNLEPITKLY